MEKAKAAISDFVSRSGHHDTTVHETVAPAVQHETVKPHQHEEINTAVDKEVHQDHYHRSVQPVHDREVLPETHTAKLGAVQNREFDHRDHDATKRNLVQDQAQFKNETRTDATTSSRSVAPAVGGEHIHHHIHETIQPVVQKETIQPNVIHTTVPIHEVHHNKATHHDTTSLPALTMDQFKSKGGSLTGREERFDEFEGIPKNIGSGSSGGFGSVRSGEHKSHVPTEHSRHGDYDSAPNHHSTAGGVGGAVGAAAASGLAGHKQHDHTDRGLTGSSTTGSGQHHLTDRNAPGQGNLTGSSTTGGLTGSGQNHLTDRNTTGHSTLPGSTTGTGGLTGSNQHHTDRNHQHGQGLTGKVADASQQHQADRGLGGQGNLTGSSTQTGMSTSTSNNPTSGQRLGTDGVIGGVHSSDHDLAHRQNEDGDLPRALVEDKSKAVPHSAIHDGKHGHDSTHDRSHDNATGSTTHKPSLMDKLNPNVDSNGDGKAGFMK